MSKKKVGLIIAGVVVVAAAAAGGLWYFLKGSGSGGSSADKVYVEAVSSLNSANSGVQNRYSGVVEPQETWEVNKNAEKTIKECFVAEGDVVEVGTPLFEYDTEDLKAELQQANLELEGMRNEISNYESQIKQLKEEKAAAPEEEKFRYTSEILTLQNSIKQTQYNIESKKIEMEKKQQSIDNSTVNSEIAGVVKSISENGYNNMTGEAEAYMTILATGDYRVKGTISEQNIWTISEGQPVLLRSRIDEEQTWTGTISKIDTENEEKNNNSYYYDSGSAETSTKYPFYVSLDSTDGLLLGQHLFIEMDEGQMETKEGVWLYEGYIVMDEEEPYVWAANKKDKLEKRKVELGDYDENLCEYQIISGITEDDYIAFPMNGLYEGVATVTNADEVDYSSPLYNQEGTGDDGMMDDGMIDDGMIDDGAMMDEDGNIIDDGAMMDEDGNIIDDGGLEEGELPDGAGMEGEAQPEESETQGENGETSTGTEEQPEG